MIEVMFWVTCACLVALIVLCLFATWKWNRALAGWREAVRECWRILGESHAWRDLYRDEYERSTQWQELAEMYRERYDRIAAKYGEDL